MTTTAPSPQEVLTFSIRASENDPYSTLSRTACDIPLPRGVPGRLQAKLANGIVDIVYSYGEETANGGWDSSMLASFPPSRYQTGRVKISASPGLLVIEEQAF